MPGAGPHHPVHSNPPLRPVPSTGRRSLVRAATLGRDLELPLLKLPGSARRPPLAARRRTLPSAPQ